MKNLWFLIFLLVAGCSGDSGNTKQATNVVKEANESANNQIEALLASRYSAISNWGKNLPRHGADSAVFSIDVQKALTSSSPILFTAHLHDVWLSISNGMTHAQFTQTYKSEQSVTSKDFQLVVDVQLNSEQTQKILSAPKDVPSDEYALVAKVSSVESSGVYPVGDDWPTLYVEGVCVDFSLLK